MFNAHIAYIHYMFEYSLSEIYCISHTLCFQICEKLPLVRSPCYTPSCAIKCSQSVVYG